MRNGWCAWAAGSAPGARAVKASSARGPLMPSRTSSVLASQSLALLRRRYIDSRLRMAACWSADRASRSASSRQIRKLASNRPLGGAQTGAQGGGRSQSLDVVGQQVMQEGGGISTCGAYQRQIGQRNHDAAFLCRVTFGLGCAKIQAFSFVPGTCCTRNSVHSVHCGFMIGLSLARAWRGGGTESHYYCFCHTAFGRGGGFGAGRRLPQPGGGRTRVRDTYFHEIHKKAVDFSADLRVGRDGVDALVCHPAGARNGTTPAALLDFIIPPGSVDARGFTADGRGRRGFLSLAIHPGRRVCWARPP